MSVSIPESPQKSKSVFQSARGKHREVPPFGAKPAAGALQDVGPPPTQDVQAVSESPESAVVFVQGQQPLPIVLPWVRQQVVPRSPPVFQRVEAR